MLQSLKNRGTVARESEEVCRCPKGLGLHALAHTLAGTLRRVQGSSSRSPEPRSHAQRLILTSHLTQHLSTPDSSRRDVLSPAHRIVSHHGSGSAALHRLLMPAIRRTHFPRPQDPAMRGLWGLGFFDQRRGHHNRSVERRTPQTAKRPPRLFPERFLRTRGEGYGASSSPPFLLSKIEFVD